METVAILAQRIGVYAILRQMPKGLTDEELIVASCREDLAVYIGLVHKTDTQTAAIPPKHLRDRIIPAIMDDSLGHTLIVAPPGSAKTNTMIGAGCWWLGQNSSQHIAYVCDNSDAAIERSMAIRAVIEESPEYHAIFPDVRADYKRGWSQDIWYLQRPNRMDKNPSFFAAGMTSSILGKRLNRVIFDDVWNQDIANSETNKGRALEKIEKEIMTRLDPWTGRAIGICTRWGEDDFAAWAKDKGWTVIEIPAIDEQGESYWEQYWPRTKLRCIDDAHDPDGGQCCKYREVGSLAFAQQYMGLVMPEENAKVKPSWWRYFDNEPDEWDKGCITVDTAGWDSTTKTGDYCVVNAWARSGNDYYNLWVERGRWSFNDVERVVMDMQASYSLPVLVEDVPWARPLIDRLKKVAWGVIPWKVKGRSKENRIDSVVHLIEAGNCWLPRKAAWVDNFVSELANFPKAKFDDQVDTSSMALMYLSQGSQKKALTKRVPFTRNWGQLSA